MAEEGGFLVASLVANVAQLARNGSLTQRLADRDQQLVTMQGQLARALALGKEVQAQLESERAARAGVETERHNLRLQLADIRAKYDALIGAELESRGREATLTRDLDVARARVREVEAE